MNNKEEKSPQQQEGIDRRDLVRKATYTIPAILAAVKASERPAYAQGSGAPVHLP